MKLFSDYPNANMSMDASKELCTLLSDLLLDGKVRYVLETGTYKGLGSTRFVADSFPAAQPPTQFVTIESNWESWRCAKQNLHPYPFVIPAWGQTVDAKRALRFLENDEMLRDHERYPDVFIDNVESPFEFYSNEVGGNLGAGYRSRLDSLRWLRDRLLSYAGTNLLEKYLQKMKKNVPLVILDSSGGVGFLEFQILSQIMSGENYYLLLDDINHIKHVRSYEHVKDAAPFTILGIDTNEGWLLAKHSAYDESPCENDCGA